ncbi:MAG: hypothetical protein NTV49_15860 [Kiritimatiellaeota bacterium]|nr:hypothetical protein [Kiritimatiellota bacterium]
MKTWILSLLSLVCLATLASALEQRELLARHETVAVFSGAPFRKCLGLTTLCPDKCDGSGEFATFEIRGYLAYEKPGQYGDPKQGQFMVRVSDFNKQPVGDPQWRAVIQTIKPGDWVALTWNHDYVTRDGSKSPERPLVNLKKLSAEEAAELLKQAEPAPPAPKTPAGPRGVTPRAMAF